MSITLSLPNYVLTGAIRHDANLRMLELIDPDTGDSEVLSITRSQITVQPLSASSSRTTASTGASRRS